MGILQLPHMRHCVILNIIRLRQRRDSQAVALFGNGKEVHMMDTLEILTFVLVIFTILSYLDNHHKK